MAKQKTGVKAASAPDNTPEFKSIYDYAIWLKSQIKIQEIFTELTGEKFVNIGGRLRARAVWRGDKTPSLYLHEGSNTLTDFAQPSNYRNKPGEIINHIDILMKLNQVTTFFGGVEWLANKLGETIPSDLQKTAGKYENLNKVLNLSFAACLENAQRFLADPNHDKYKDLNAFCVKRHIPLDAALWTKLNIGAWPHQPDIACIVDNAGIKLTKKEKTDAKKADLGLTDVPRIHDNAAIVFPLHDVNGILVGLALRPATSKYILKAQINDNGAYGMLDVLRDTKKDPNTVVYVTEGQFNKIQYTSQIFREFGEEGFDNSLSPILSTGSKHYSLNKIKKYIKNACYFPDNDIGNGHDKSYVDTVVDVYNQLEAELFYTIFWEGKTDHYDIDDFIRENLELPFDEMKKSLRIVSIVEFIVLAINDMVAGIPDARQKNSAKFVHSSRIIPKLYNPSDRADLLKVFSFEQADLDPEFQSTYNREHRRELGDHLIAHKNRYILAIPDPKGGADQEVEISKFVLEVKQRVIRKEALKAALRESEHSAHEVASYDCYIYHTNGKRTEAIYRAQDFADVKAFIAALAKTDMDARASIVLEYERQVFQAVLKCIDIKTELLQFIVPGPHLANLSPEAVRGVLRPDMFNRSLKTYLNRNISVISGKTVSNRSLGFEFVNANSLEFGLYTDEEHRHISRMLWHDFRSIQHKQLVSGFLGFTFCIPFKHLLLDDISGMSCFVVGGTKTGKTSLALMCQNFYGTILSDSALLNFHTTLNAFERQVTRLGDTLVVCDEYRPNPLFSLANLSTVLHNMWNGKPKDRLMSTSELMGSDPYSGNYVITGEQVGKMQASTEARHLQFEFKEEDKTTEEHYIKVRSNLSQFKCFMPRLICWQHDNTESIQNFYKSRKQQLFNKYKETQNGSRIAKQVGAIDTGFYSFLEMLKDQGSIDRLQAEDEFLEYLDWSANDFSEKQVYRSEESQHHKVFMKSLSTLIHTNALNMVIMKGETVQSTSIDRYTQDLRRQVLVMKFKKHNEWHYALLSFELILNEINKTFHNRDFSFEYSILRELNVHKIIKLNQRNQIEATKIPNIMEPSSLKSVRVVVISESKLREFDDE